MLHSGHQQFTVGLSQVLVFSHRLQRYFSDNIVFQLVCSDFKTEISSFLQKNKNVFFTRIVFLSTLAKKFCKNRIFLPYFGVFRQISLRSCKKHVVSASLQHLAVILGKKKSAQFKCFFSVFKVFLPTFLLRTLCVSWIPVFFRRFYRCFAENITFKLVRIDFGREIS